MAEQQLNAPPCASSGVRAGVHHVRHRHTERFTMVGNHLAQHDDLSPTAIGLGVHIQSLPDGVRIDIRTLRARFPQTSTARIAAALRELEAHGYLERVRKRGRNGCVGISTVFHERPVARPCPAKPARKAVPRPARRPAPPPAPPAAAPAAAPARVDLAARVLAGMTGQSPAAHPEAAAVLAGLRHEDDRLLLSRRDVDRLAPAVAEWLHRGASPTSVRRALTAGLPAEPIRHPAGLISHRLAAFAPPPLSARAPAALRPDPLQNCPGCERAFRSPAPGRCRECREAPDDTPPTEEV